MNPLDEIQSVREHPPHYVHVNPANLNWQWNHGAGGLPISQGSYVRVNPAFFQQNLPTCDASNPKRIIVNPKFFPQVQHEKTSNLPSTHLENVSKSHVLKVQNAHPSNVNDIELVQPVKKQPGSKPAVNQHHVNVRSTEKLKGYSKPSPIRHPGDRSKLTKFNFTNTPLKSKYKWKKTESPLKNAVAVKHAFKLVRVTPVLKATRESTFPSRQNSFKFLTPPKLTSTPIETQRTNSRFKLDNRTKNKKKSTKYSNPRTSLAKILLNKYKLIQNKCWKPSHLSFVKFGANRSVNRGFTNFKSPLNKPIVLRNSKFVLTQQQMLKKNKTNKKKVKSPKKKARSRYYDDASCPKPEEETFEDVEITAKPSGPKIRTPLGALPSFITL